MSNKVFALLVIVLLSVSFISPSNAQAGMAKALTQTPTANTEGEDVPKIPPYFTKILKQYEGIMECPYQAQLSAENIAAIPDDGSTTVTISESLSPEGMDWPIIYQTVCYFIDWEVNTLHIRETVIRESPPDYPHLETESLDCGSSEYMAVNELSVAGTCVYNSSVLRECLKSHGVANLMSISRIMAM